MNTWNSMDNFELSNNLEPLRKLLDGKRVAYFCLDAIEDLRDRPRRDFFDVVVKEGSGKHMVEPYADIEVCRFSSIYSPQGVRSQEFFENKTETLFVITKELAREMKKLKEMPRARFLVDGGDAKTTRDNFLAMVPETATMTMVGGNQGWDRQRLLEWVDARGRYGTLANLRSKNRKNLMEV
jgi:hypothetical protein